MKKLTISEALFDGFESARRDALWGHIYLRPEIDALARTRPFARLNRILQLGPASLVYPCATHTRAAHSIGVYAIARRIITVLCERGAEAFVTGQGIRSFLCAALLHDIGHFPYAHALKELPLESHEALGARLVETEPLASYISRAGGDPLLTACIIDTARPTTEREALFYRKILSGCLDPDKLDYLNRDARFAGVPYGIQDVDFILSRLYPHEERGIDIDSRAIPSVESVLFSKYLMYRAVYWHKNVRAATALMKKKLYTALKTHVFAPEELYDLDDAGLFALLYAKNTGSALQEAALALQDGLIPECINEEPYQEALHKKLEDLDAREEAEEALSREYGRPVLIDVPEKTGFETGLFVRDERNIEKSCPFEESQSVFGKGGVDAFVKTLRRIRYFVYSA